MIADILARYLALLVLMPLLAVLMAQGFGVPLAAP